MYVIASHGEFLYWTIENGIQREAISWNLEKDLDWHYYNQPETVKFLIKLLIR